MTERCLAMVAGEGTRRGVLPVLIRDAYVVVAPWTIVDIFFYAINTAGMLNFARS
jgi:hypothetical protein